MIRPLYLTGALIWGGGGQPTRRDLCCAWGRVTAAPSIGARRVDLDGCFVYPALINPHDHLELNHYPRSAPNRPYDNAHQWGEDLNSRLDDEPFRSLRAYPLDTRLFIGGLKNLLCGALTVVQHGPPHRSLFGRGYPVRVLRRYGWAHSLHFSTDAEIITSYRRTPPGWPWFIHLAEGTDSVAAGEYQRLKALGCAGPNTILIHGVGLTDADRADAIRTVRGLVRCPSTNIYLLGRTAAPDRWGTKVALGSDSRLTADGDLLDEMRIAGWDPTNGANLLGLADCGHLRAGARADWIATRGGPPQRRADLALIVRGGIPRIGDPDLMARFPHVPSIPARLDGKPKRIHAALARQIERCTLREPGLEIDA